jgi:uncharacterized protein YoxC
MPVWFYALLALCALALTAALVAAVVAVTSAVRRSERVLAALQREVDHDLPPLLGELRDLVAELRRLSRGVGTELERIGEITGRVQDVAEGASRVFTALAGLTRVGQVVGIAAGLKTGIDVFLHRIRQRGDGHG